MKIDLFDDEMFEEEPQQPERPPREPRKRRRGSGETAKRVLVALPWIGFAIAITVAGGPIFALAMAGLGIVAVGEFAGIASRYRPLVIPAYIAVAGLIAAAYLGTSYSVLMALAASVPLLFAFAARARYREGATVSLGITLLGVVWIGVPLAHAVFLRELPDHGAALLIDVLVGTFVADTAAYATGRMFGSHKIAPNLSPNKTIEGLIGGFVIGTMGFWFAGLYQDWLSGVDALIIGAAVAAMAPVGDLFESLLKRDLGTKDTGTLFGPHGGLLDRLDAVFFTVVVGYYLAVVVVY
ncbi:MAG TPA: phosphatidate cytidylyltransferase [Solirubrobacterales bacterium]|nr:phosphatidate cytidylyltransferase [Solirubrobacterales bacterium]